MILITSNFGMLHHSTKNTFCRSCWYRLARTLCVRIKLWCILTRTRLRYITLKTEDTSSWGDLTLQHCWLLSQGVKLSEEHIQVSSNRLSVFYSEVPLFMELDAYLNVKRLVVAAHDVYFVEYRIQVWNYKTRNKLTAIKRSPHRSNINMLSIILIPAYCWVNGNKW